MTKHKQTKIEQASVMYKLRQHKVLFLVISLVVLIGVAVMVISYAATATASIEPENATATGNASVVTDSTASGGKAVSFKSTTAHTAPCGWGAKLSTYKHVVWIWMENKDQSVVIGSAPYIDSIKAACGSATNVQDNATSAALTSEPQYAAATAGSNCVTGINTTGTGCIVNNNDYGPSNSLTTTSIFQLVKNSGGTWKSYQESMPTNCALTTTNPYAYKHNPAAFFTSIAADCKTNDVGMPAITCSKTANTVCTVPTGAFADDIKAGALPTFSFITPNLTNDMHDGTIIQGDNWFNTYMQLLLAGPNYQAGDTVIFLMWDEGSSNTASSSTAIPTLIIAPSIKPGTSTAIQTNNIGLLKTTQELLGLTPLLGCATGTPPGNVGTCGAGSSTSIRTALGL